MAPLPHIAPSSSPKAQPLRHEQPLRLMKADIWDEVSAAVASGGPTPKLEAALGNILSGRSNNFPAPPPAARTPSDTDSDSPSPTTKENAPPRRRLRRDMLPSDSDSPPPTPTKKPSAFFRQAARRAYAPTTKADPRLQLRRALVDAVGRCGDATHAAQLIRNDGPAALGCATAELWAVQAATNTAHWSCDEDKGLAEAVCVAGAARQGGQNRSAWPVAIDGIVLGVLEIQGAPWPFDAAEGAALAEACAAPLRRSADVMAHARDVAGYERRVEELSAKGHERKRRLADALRVGESEREARGHVEDALRATHAAHDALREEFRRSLGCQNDWSDRAIALKDAACARSVAAAAREVLRARSDAAARAAASLQEREAALRATMRAIEASHERINDAKEAALRTTLGALANDGRLALRAKDAADDLRARAEAEAAQCRTGKDRAEEILRKAEDGADARVEAAERACEDRVRQARDAQRAQHAACAAALSEASLVRSLLDEERRTRRDEAEWRDVAAAKLRRRRILAVATALHRARRRWRRERLAEALAVWLEDAAVTARVAAVATRVALRIHGAPPAWWTPAVDAAALKLARRVDAAEAAAAASLAARASRAEEASRERRCGGAVAHAAQKATARAKALFAAAATGGDATLVGVVADGARAIASSDAEVTLFGGAHVGKVARIETSVQIPSDHGPLGLVATGALDATGRAELEGWCLLAGHALDCQRALAAAAKVLGQASDDASRRVRAADRKAVEAVDDARRGALVLDAVAANGDAEELSRAALDDGGADEITARVVVLTPGSWEATVVHRTPVGRVEVHGSAWCAPVKNGCLVVHAGRPRPPRYAALLAQCAAIVSRTRSKPVSRRKRLRVLVRRATASAQRMAWARWRRGAALYAQGELDERLVASEARGVELGLAADAALRARGSLERACDDAQGSLVRACDDAQRELRRRRRGHALAVVEHCARRCATAGAAASSAAAAARAGSAGAAKARAWRAAAKDGRSRTKRALGDLELIRTQLAEASGTEARAAALAIRARELETDRRRLRDELATRDAAQRLGRAPRRASLSPLSPATARWHRSPSPSPRVAFADTTPPPRALRTPSDQSLQTIASSAASAAEDRRDALALRAAELEARQRGVRDALSSHRSRTSDTTTSSSSGGDSLVGRTLRVLRDQLPSSPPESPVEEA